MENDTPEEAPTERQRPLAAVAGQAVRQAALLRLSADLGAVLEESEVCRRVADGLHDTLDYDFVALLLANPGSQPTLMAQGPHSWQYWAGVLMGRTPAQGRGSLPM